MKQVSTLGQERRPVPDRLRVLNRLQDSVETHVSAQRRAGQGWNEQAAIEERSVNPLHTLCGSRRSEMRLP